MHSMIMIRHRYTTHSQTQQQSTNFQNLAELACNNIRKKL